MTTCPDLIVSSDVYDRLERLRREGRVALANEDRAAVARIAAEARRETDRIRTCVLDAGHPGRKHRAADGYTWRTPGSRRRLSWRSLFRFARGGEVQ